MARKVWIEPFGHTPLLWPNTLWEQISIALGENLEMFLQDAGKPVTFGPKFADV